MNSKKRIGLLIPGMSRGGAERVAAILTKILDHEFDVFLIVYHCTKMAYPIMSMNSKQFLLPLLM